MLKPLPTQLSGARFLAERQTALLADSPRVGKTGAAIIAADLILAQTILVITTASGRAVWRRGFETWSRLPRTLGIGPGAQNVVIISWAGATSSTIRALLLMRRFDLMILDESHYAKSFEAARTCAVYGDPRTKGDFLADAVSLRSRCATVWCLSGTPLPNSPADLYPMMRSLCPERLGEYKSHAAFMRRYVQTRPQRISRFRTVDVVIGGQNLDELHQRLDGFILRRTQADVGIRAPVYETLPLLVSDKTRKSIENVDTKAVLAAAEAGDTRALEMHLGPVRRLTGEIKARAVVEAVKEELDNGLDKIVLMAWHRDVISHLAEALADYGVVVIEGSTSARDREQAEIAFREDGKIRIAVGQIQAAGEAIDLSAAAVLFFVEMSFVPKDGQQASLRITNVNQHRQAFVKVCTLSGSIDEALQSVLLRKMTAIREVLK